MHSEPTPPPAAGDVDIIIGIDLGTTNSLAAYSDRSGPQVLKNVGDGTTTDASGMVPSVVYIPAEGSPVVGADARAKAVQQPLRTIYSIKRLMGIGPADAAGELPYLAYQVVTAATEAEAQRDPTNSAPAEPDGTSAGLVYVQVDDRRYSPQEISAIILRAVKRRADLHFGRDVRKAVITVPAYFNDSQRQATRDAGRIAGLDVVRIVSEPTAAALAYGLGERDLREQKEKRLLAGALFSKPADPNAAPPAASPADTTGEKLVAVYDLGGGTFDVSILQVSRLAENEFFQVLATDGDTHLGGDDFDRALISLFTDEITQRLGRDLDFPPSTRQALRDFAEATKMRLSEAEQAAVEIAIPGASNFTYRRTVTRAEFEQRCAALVQKTISKCRSALKAAGKQPRDVAEVVLVGGMTRVPMIKRAVAAFFGRTPYDAINPDEVVALGAAVQASILAGVRRDLLLLDVIPLSLGVETFGGGMGKLITQNTPIPCEATELFSTFVDGQTKVAIHVLQGERELAADCRSLARFELTGVPPMPAGLPKIQVKFLVDANGILNVSAVELRSGVAASIQVIPSHGLTQPEVDRLTAESIANAEADFRAHRLIDLRNQIERDTIAASRNLARVGDQLTAEDRATIQRQLEQLKQLATTNDPEPIHAALDQFNHHPATIRLAELAVTAALSR